MKKRRITLSTPLPLIELFEYLSAQGCEASIIGGFTRDFLLFNSISQDVDIEIRWPVDVEILEKTKSLFSKLILEYPKYEMLSFNILRLFISEYEVEISLPRKEKFNNLVHHSNFEATFIHDENYTVGSIRRDFTVNAISFVYKKGEWILEDPTQGLLDLKEKKLVMIDEEIFPKDPVRFLRALRFKIAKGFCWDSKLLREMKTFDLTQNSSFYIKKESEKSGAPIRMLGEIFKMKFLVPEEVIYEYDLLFENNLEAHIKFAPFIFDKKVICKKIGFSDKNIISFSEALDIRDFEDSKEIIDFFLSSFSKYKFSRKKSEYLFDKFFLNLNFRQYEKLKKIQVSLSSEEKKNAPSSYKWILLRRKLEAI